MWGSMMQAVGALVQSGGVVSIENPRSLVPSAVIGLAIGFAVSLGASRRKSEAMHPLKITVAGPVWATAAAIVLSGSSPEARNLGVVLSAAFMQVVVEKCRTALESKSANEVFAAALGVLRRVVAAAFGLGNGAGGGAK